MYRRGLPLKLSAFFAFARIYARKAAAKVRRLLKIEG